MGRRFQIAAWAVFLMPLIGSGSSRAADLNAGFATVDITPPVGYRMSGYFKERISRGVHDSLRAKAIVFVQGDTQAALIICDLIGIPLEVSTSARKAISAKARIPLSNIAITATHTHTGPLFFGTIRNYLHDAAVAKYGNDPCEPIEYAAQLVDKLVEVAVQAQSAVRPVEFAVGQASQSPPISFNRRWHMRDGSVRSNPPEHPPQAEMVRPAGPTDSDVSFLAFRDPRGKAMLAGLTVFALHLDTTDGTEYSADYPYYLEQYLRAEFGGHFVSIFGTSTCGNINHIDIATPRQRNASEIGPLLARTVLATVPALHAIEKPSLAVRSVVVKAPLQKYGPDQTAQAGRDVMTIGTGRLPFLKEVEAYKIVELQRRSGTTIPLEIQAVRLNSNVAILTLPGEPFVELGLAIKRSSPFKTTFIIELANDNPAYIPTSKAFAEGSYETVNSRICPGGGEMLVSGAVQLLKDLAGD